MGCDIITTAVRIGHGGDIEFIRPGNNREYLDSRNYSVFAFLADARNHEHIKPIAESRGYPYWILEPQRAQNEWIENFGQTWFSVQELLDFDYEAKCTETETYREFLGAEYFSDLERMQQDGVTHIFCEFNS